MCNNSSEPSWRGHSSSPKLGIKCMPSNDSCKIKHLLEVEKNVLDYTKTFITISFMLNSGGIAILMAYKSNFFQVIGYLLSGAIIAIVMYLFSAILFGISVVWNDEYRIFIRSRVASYVCISLGIFSSVISFYYAAYYGVRIIAEEMAKQ